MTRGHKIYLIPVLSKPIGFHRRDTLKPSGRIGSKKTISNLHTARISLMGNSTPNLLHKDTDIRGISLHTQPTHDAPTERRQAASTKHKHGRGKQKKRGITRCCAAIPLFFFVVPPGIEPGTQGFSVLCSTN